MLASLASRLPAPEKQQAKQQSIKEAGVELDAQQKKLIFAAVSWTNPDAELVIE
ncbi:hypothetical protein SAMN06265222_11435 [Neorhodopirellula lusitana]|uniref:Uncharacterized protein n=1 Tax=Neorhodopirellula lusitana TaxID=445327 RepID=A0ABY1QKJ4_9BACT|nr:hypothetical protein [Neorhodopirellula lusitana]SMP71329.1 hypothetical protein SAMN06265222_11435 [Neorhodopirellula lusitana]